MTTGTSNRYDETNIQTMELVYGRGYMSAGGDEEVARIVGTVTITNKKILDIGCGLGGAVISLVATTAPHTSMASISTMACLIARHSLSKQPGSASV
ncbi:MAG: hypothetical protein Ct9H300mP16_15800 [Pseudomonadota bacterium]|nr:MAG: hypothetical protein Ct9H300mP16_15800 [Pseudomonadota bacterium]